MAAEVPLFLNVTVSLPSALFTKVRRYTLADALNTTPEMTVEVFGTDPDVDMADLLGQAATVELCEPAVPRFDGIVRHVEQRPLDLGGVSVFALTIVPRPWLLHERAGHRIFQNRDALEIAGDVLAPYGEAMDRPEGTILQHVLPSYEYRVQCGETDHDFLFRILSEHGLVSSWSPDAKGQRRWIVTDDTTAGGADMDVPYRSATGALAATEPHVSVATVHASLCASEARLRDYDYRKPAFLLEQRFVSGDAVVAEEALARYSFALGRFEDEPGGELLAGRRLEQARSKSRTYRWEASFALRPGMRVRLHDHPRDEANGDFLVVSAWTEVDLGSRKHVAEVVPAAFPWRPEVLSKPRIHGTQTAFVVSTDGQEIDVDEEGRIAVRFHWDTRRDGASRRVRVAMPWAGPGRGFWTVPRAGDEVVIGYLDGDPDQPMVVGSVTNARAPVPFPLPERRAQSIWLSCSTPGGEGHNYVAMDDTAGAEILGLRAQRDFECEALRDSTTTVGGASRTSIVGDSSLTANKIAIHSTSDMDIRCDGSRSDTTTAFHTVVAHNLTLTGAASATLNGTRVDVLATVEGGTVEIEAAASISLKVGSASITLVDGKITLSAPLVELNP